MCLSTRRIVAFGLGLSLTCACTDETNAGEPSGGGNAGAGAIAGASGSSGAAGSSVMMGGSGGVAMTTPDSGAPGGSGGAGQGGSGSLPGCPRISPRPVPGQTIAIVAINIPARIVYIQNVSDSDVELTYPEWQWCSLPAYGRLVTSNRTLAPGERFTASGLDGFSGEVAGAEMAIYDNVSFSDPDSMRAYLVWNTRAEQGREDTASQAGLWTYLDRATVEPGDVGLYATGPTNEASGYTSVPASCFPLSP